MAEDESDDQEWNIRLRQDEEMDFFTELALHEAERWIQAVTRKKFKYPDDFRGSLANGVLLCELLNGLKPGSVKRINKLPGAIAGLDNVNVFLNSCAKNFGLNKTQLFDPSDLEDLSQRAIADESEHLLKQEVDRRARNVAVTIYWLGRQVEGTFKGATLDVSAFAALVHHQGTRNIISDECFKNENSWQMTRTSKETYKDVNPSDKKHARDSSYDSLGSYEKGSESSFDELETNENMPVRDHMRRYGSQSSLGKDNTRYSVANDSAFSDRHDSLYQSSPDLSQGSHAHTRSSSTDSMDGSYYGNSHSRQSSGSTENYPTRTTTKAGRRTSSTTSDPMQFVKIKGADELAKTAAKQIEAAKETNLMRPNLRGDEGEPDWQSKLSGWKNRRKSASAAVYQRVGEVEGVFTETEEEPKTKTFSQIMAEKEKRRSLGNLRSFYPVDDDDDGGIGPKLKLNDPLHIMKSEEEITEATEKKMKKKAKGEEIAPWARDSSGEGDSQSDSETSTSHQSGDKDNVFSDQTVSKVVNTDESWVRKRSSGKSQTSPSVRQTPPLVGNKSIKDRNMQLWENSAKESQTKVEKKKMDIPTSNNKIRNITKAFEEKESSAKAEPVITRRSEFNRKSWSVDSTDSPFIRRSSDNSDKSDKFSPKGFNDKNVSPLLSPTAPKALLPKDQRTSGSNFKFPADYSSNKPVENITRSRYIQKMSASPTGPFGYRGRPSSSDKDAQSTNDKEHSPLPSQDRAVKPLRTSSTAGSESSGIISPTTSEVFYPLETSPNTTSVSAFGPASSKDIGSDFTLDPMKIHASALFTVSSSPAILCSDASPKISATGTPSSSNVNISGVDDNMSAFHIPSLDDKSPFEPRDVNEFGLDPVTRASEATEERPSSDLDINNEIINRLQHDSERNSDMAQMYAANMLNCNNEPEVFLFPASAQDAQQEAESDSVIEEYVKSSQRADILVTKQQTSDQDPFFSAAHAAGNIETCMSDGTMATDNNRNKDVDSDSDEEGMALPIQISADVSKEIHDPAEDEPTVSLAAASSEDLPFVEGCESSAPDLISSIPFLPLLTPYGSEESTTEKIICSPYDEDVFFNEVKPDVHGPGEDKVTVINEHEKKFIEKTIKISQDPNNSRGFGFFIVGGTEKREPITIQRVSLGSSADLCDVLAKDELLSVNGKEVTNMTLKQVQAIVDHSVKRGQIELKIRRQPDEGSFDSMEEEGGGFLERPGNNSKGDAQSDSSSFSTDPLSDDASYNKAPQISSRQTGSDDSEKPSLMDRLLAEKSRETNNNFDLSMYKTDKKAEKPPSPVQPENLKAEISFSSQVAPSRPSRRSPVTTLPNRQSPVTAVPNRQSPVTIMSSRRSPVTETKTEATVGVKSESLSGQKTETEHDIIGPDGDTMVEERQTISVKPKPVVEEEPVVVMRRKRTPMREEVTKTLETLPPAPPAAEPPTLTNLGQEPAEEDESGGFGPPAALRRWQRPRAKSEYINPYHSLFDKQVEESKRLSSTLPWRSTDNDNRESKETTKDDSVLTRVTKDFESTVSVSKPPLTKSKTYHFDDVPKLEDWDKKQEMERKHEPQDERPVTPPAFEVEIKKEERLTPQLSSKPGRKVGVPNLMEIPVIIPGKDETPLSPQEKFERDQQRIRQQYEEEKRKAKEAEKEREEQEQQMIQEDASRLLHLESQIQPDKLEDIKPVHPPVQSQPPQFTSDPLTIKIPANSQGRQLVIDPRNQVDQGETALPHYSFHVDLQNQENRPQLRNLNQEPELSPEELLEKERQRIREEEHRKFEEEKRRWKEEQDEKLRKEEERLKEEREAIEREKARWEQNHEPRYQPVSSHTYQSPRSSSGSTGSSVSHSPRSPPPALDPHHRGFSVPSRKAEVWAPPSAQHTHSKTDSSSKEKARLTREDLLAMNRKATPLQTVQNKIGGGDSVEKEPEPKTREAPTKLELHMLNSVPKPRFRRSADWIKDDEQENSVQTDKFADKKFVIGSRSDIIHNKDYSNPQDHWVVQEAERRRLAEHKDYSRRSDSDSLHTAGPAKPSGSSLVNRFRGDTEPNKNRYSYPAPRDTDSRHSSSRPLSTGGSGLRKFERSASPELSSTQFSARNQSPSYANPSLSNTLPANFSFNANKPLKREPPAPAPKPQRSPTEQADQMHTVSGKQKCSHCNEELGFGAAMVIESLGLYYHVQCFRCCVCRTPLGNGSEGADVRVRVNKLHCRNCFSNDEAGLKFSKV